MKKLTSVMLLLTFGAAAGCSSSPVVLTPKMAPTATPVASPAPTNTPTAAVQYFQIERLSRPAIKEVFEPFQAHQISNAAEPYADTTIQGDIKGTEDALRPPNAAVGSDYGAALASILYPDEYHVNLNGAAPSGADPFYFLSYEVTGGAAFGGRAPNDDVIYLELGALFGGILPAIKVQPDDNEEDTCLSGQNIGGQGMPGGQDPAKLTGNTFPYLAGPS